MTQTVNDAERYTSEEFVKRREHLIEKYHKNEITKNILTDKYAPAIASEFDMAVMVQIFDNVIRNFYPYRPNEETPQDFLDEVMKDAERNAKVEGWPRGRLSEATTVTQTSAWSGATMIPIILGMNRKIMPKIIGLDLVQVQPISLPTARVFFLRRFRHTNGSNTGDVENRNGWSYRSWWDDPGEATAITKSTTFTITSADVSAVSRKLKAETSIEVEQDLRAYFGMDAMALLSEAATDELAAEISEHLVHRMWHAAKGTSGGGIGYLGTKPTGYTWEEWDRKLIEAYARISENIESSQRVRPNWLVLGSAHAVRVQQLSNFEIAPKTTPATYGLRVIGNLAGDWTVYKQPLPFPTADALLGYKGNDWVDGSYFWLPYIPLQPYTVEMTAGTMVRTISWIRRDAEYMLDQGHFGLVQIDEASYTGTSYPAFSESTGN